MAAKSGNTAKAAKVINIKTVTTEMRRDLGVIIGRSG